MPRPALSEPQAEGRPLRRAGAQRARGSETPPSSEQLRLLIVAPSAVAGGMEEIEFNLATCLPAAGIKPKVIALQAGPLVERLDDHGACVQVLDAGRMRNVLRMREVSRMLTQELRRGRYDAVFSGMPKAQLYTAFAARRAGVPSLWCQAGHPAPAHWTDRLASRLPADGVVALSRDAAQAQLGLGARCPVHVLHPGLDLDRFTVRRDADLRRRHGIPVNAVLVSLVGRLQPWKGQREFLRAAAEVLRSHSSAYFAVVGGAILGWEGDYPQELERLAASLGLRDRVVFTGHTDEVPGWMAASDVVVNASDPEPFGLVVIEALASGCPVVALAIGGPRDIVRDGCDGLLCPDRRPETLAASIGRLIGNPELRARVGAAARARVEAQFSRERMAESFASIVRQTPGVTTGSVRAAPRS